MRRHGLQERKAIIEEITHKIEFRQFDCLQNFEDQFPDDFLAVSYQIPLLPDGEIDVNEFARSLEKLNEPLNELDKMVQSSFLTPTSYAKIAQRSILATICHFSSSPELPIRCCAGTAEEFVRAEALLESDDKIVADSSVIATLFALSIHEKIDSLPKRHIISEGTLDLFRRVSQDPNLLFSKRRMGAFRGKMFVHEITDDQLEEQKESFQNFYSWIEKNFESRGGIGRAELDSASRKELELAFGEETAESVGLAIAEKAILWTDDHAIAVTVGNKLLTNRVWTDVLFESYRRSNHLPDKALAEIKLALIDFGYTFTRLEFETAKLGFQRSNWSCSARPLNRLIDWFHNSGILGPGAVAHAANMLEFAWRQAPLGHQPVEFTKAICRSIAKREDAETVLRALVAVVGTKFGIDVVSKRECLKIIASQLELELAQPKLILPDDPEWIA